MVLRGATADAADAREVDYQTPASSPAASFRYDVLMEVAQKLVENVRPTSIDVCYKCAMLRSSLG
ncbi:hypothetical protein E4U43_005992 [Claviceps pusilla]|uniref:Uncharacterized protein n=1 Tax=Claviceps pusilla TaxID=123648 RepID=A0A9P7NEI7_9HYPO|nr:hypothetical protein E4U43_005992 [Claviceps pusilla]